MKKIEAGGLQMSTSMLLGMFDWIADFFKALFDLIPKIMYLLYSSLACVLDVLQLFFRKLAGLDVYYVDGKAVTGDLVTNFITGILGINAEGFQYSALTTVFWSFIVFGVIVCFGSTIIAVIKSHYSYDDKAAKGPMQYVYTAGKAIINIVAVPVIVVLGLYVSQALLTALDTMTSISSGNVTSIFGQIEEERYDDNGQLIKVKVNIADRLLKSSSSSRTQSDEKTFIYYDIFGYGSNIFYGLNSGEGAVPSDNACALIAAKNQTFSGSLFRVAAYNGNRARLRQIAPKAENFSGTKSGELFSNTNDPEVLADMIDMAFACNLHLQKNMHLDYSSDGQSLAAGDWTSMKYFTNFLTQNASAFSKFNVGLVWYYYDLWNFNFIVGFAGCIVCVTLFINIIMGLITRLFMCVGLFLVASPLFGLSPLDGGKAGKSWRENFMKQVLMAYGAVVGMNIMFLILPYINDIDFFNIPIADYFAQTLIIIVGLITIKAFIATLSGLIGGADANETGGKISEEVGQVAGKATYMPLGAAKFAGKTVKNGASLAGNMAMSTYYAGDSIRHQVQAHNADKKANDINNLEKKENLLNQFTRTKFDDLTKEHVMKQAMDAGLSKKEAKKMSEAVEKSKERVGSADAWNSLSGADRTIASAHMRDDLKKEDKSYKKYADFDSARRIQKYVEYSDKAVKHRDKFDQAVVKSNARLDRAGGNVKGLWKGLTGIATDVYDNTFKDDKAIGTFLDKSKIKQKPNWDKMSYKQDSDALAQSKFANWMQEQSMLGRTPTADEIRAKKAELEIK